MLRKHGAAGKFVEFYGIIFLEHRQVFSIPSQNAKSDFILFFATFYASQCRHRFGRACKRRHIFMRQNNTTLQLLIQILNKLEYCLENKELVLASSGIVLSSRVINSEKWNQLKAHTYPISKARHEAFNHDEQNKMPTW